jgi:acetolactate synthase I/II/III large subunit
MNGADLLMQTLLANGVDLVVGNPGTSEMQFVAALDAVPKLRAVLALFEGVVTGAADGYGRMADRPAATLLHLGPGLGNGLANLHNARRAHTPIVNVVGEHATFHRQYDPPLHSDIESIARGASEWTRTIGSVNDLSGDVAAAIGFAREAPGHVTTVVLPADVAWSPATGEPKKATVGKPRSVPSAVVDEVAQILRRGEPAALLLNGRAVREPALGLASRIGKRAGARVLCDTFPARIERGAGRAVVERLPYIPQMILSALGGVQHLILVAAKAPVSFFAFPGGASVAVPDGCQVHTLATESDDVVAALEALAAALGAPAEQMLQADGRSPAPTGGVIEPDSFAAALGATLPDRAIVVDESNTVGYLAPMATAGCPPHDWLCLTGGSIGMGLPAATGAALACPDRRVVALDGDGSAMYTIQALWTQAREKLDVTNVILANRPYAILNLEMLRMGLGQAGPVAKQMLDLTNPTLDFVSMGKGMGVPSCRVTGAAELVAELRRSFATPGPSLIEADIKV